MNKIIPIVGLPIVVAIVVITAMYSEVVLLPNYEGMTCTELRKAAMALLQAEALAPGAPASDSQEAAYLIQELEFIKDVVISKPCSDLFYWW